VRAYLVITVVTVLVIGFGVKTFFFPNPPAQAQSQASPSASMNPFQIHLDHPRIRDLPEQRVKEPF
jgi:hypothetical protein